MKKILMTLLAIYGLSLTLLVKAESINTINGNWVINANGWKFVLNIEQTGNAIKGIMSPLSIRNAEIAIEGTISTHGEVYFRDPNQQFHGYVFQGKEKGRHMAGTFGPSNGPTFGWFAERQ